MSKTQDHNPQRIDQLMVDAATQGLSPQDQVELDAALANDPSLRREAEAYELAATATQLALINAAQDESLPQALRDKLIASATAQQTASTTAALKLAGTRADQPAAKPASSCRAFGWYAAAAALVALCLVLADPPRPEPVIVEKIVEREVVVAPTPEPEKPLGELYAALASNEATVSADWGFNADGGDERFASAAGQVIWNSDEQTGYMKLTGLPINDPTAEQYQLWIVDPARDAEPIDGGVFDITAQGEVIVPINAKLQSNSPAVFAITIEQPGGVVVSEGPLQVIAAVPTDAS